MRHAIESAAGSVLGPALSAEQAIWWIERDQPDCSIWDVDIGPPTTTLVAQRLKELSVPFVVATSFARELLPPALHTAPYLAKPFAQAELIDNVAISIDSLAVAPLSPTRMPTSKPKDLRARRIALKVPHTAMATGIRLHPILSCGSRRMRWSKIAMLRMLRNRLTNNSSMPGKADGSVKSAKARAKLS